MKLIWIGGFVVVFVSLASLVSNRQSGKLINESWTSASRVLPDTKLREMQRSTPAYAAQILARLPEPIRQKFAGQTRQPLELIIFRFFMLSHAASALFVILMVGFLEGSWARANQKALVKMHSPMRFSLALASLGFIPVLALLWIAAPLAISTMLLVFALGTVGIISTRNLVVHAPTQF
jgi:hypothetical protein